MSRGLQNFPRHDPDAPTRRVVFVAFPDCHILDLSGPLSVFYNGERTMAASRRVASPAYRTEVVAAAAGRIDSQQGLGLYADRGFAEVSGPVDTLIVAGGSGVHRAVRDGALVDWLRRVAPNVRRLCSVCTGAFALAAAGQLQGKRATTHWASCDRLAAAYPDISVEPDPIYVRDGNVYTSAGVTAGMDLALALVEEDFGRDCAITAARWLVMFAKRPGGQSQFSLHLAAQAAEREPIRQLQEWVLDNLGADLSVLALADRAGMSPRNFARVFRRETGATPADFVEAARIDAARRQLEESGASVERVAGACGFSTAEHMRRAFHRRLGASPYQYRARFQSPIIAHAEQST